MPGLEPGIYGPGQSMRQIGGMAGSSSAMTVLLYLVSESEH